MNVYDSACLSGILKENAYPGRGIVIGKTPDGKHAVAAYFIMGRSANSRNRVFVRTGDDLQTQPFDASRVEDPSLIIYSPVRQLGESLIVTNGDQTDTIYDFLAAGKSFEAALDTRCFEPDGPAFTPRISGLLRFANGDFGYKMSILKSADAQGSACNRFTYAYAPISGVGHFLHTYHCDGNPLPSFIGEPERVAMDNDMEAFTQMLWESLNEENKISLYVRYIPLTEGLAGDAKICLRNKNQ